MISNCFLGDQGGYNKRLAGRRCVATYRSTAGAAKEYFGSGSVSLGVGETQHGGQRSRDNRSGGAAYKMATVRRQKEQGRHGRNRFSCPLPIHVSHLQSRLLANVSALNWPPRYSNTFFKHAHI